MYFSGSWHFPFFRILWWIESSKEQYLFEIKIFCNIINAFTVTFDQLKVPCWIKVLISLKKIISLTPNFWMIYKVNLFWGSGLIKMDVMGTYFFTYRVVCVYPEFRGPVPACFTFSVITHTNISASYSGWRESKPINQTLLDFCS